MKVVRVLKVKIFLLSLICSSLIIPRAEAQDRKSVV